jgi:hypothetical protein
MACEGTKSGKSTNHITGWDMYGKGLANNKATTNNTKNTPINTHQGKYTETTCKQQASASMVIEIQVQL